MISNIIIALLTVALVYACWQLSVLAMERDSERSRREESERDGNAVRAERDQEEARADEMHEARAALEHELAALRATVRPRPARMLAGGGMPEEQVAETLHGTESTPLMRAVCAKITATIVQLADRSTDAPRETVVRPSGEVIAGYSAEQRLHDAGGAAHLAELLGELQDLARSEAAELAEKAG